MMLEATVRKDDCVGLITYNAWKTAERRNRDYYREFLVKKRNQGFLLTSEAL